MSVGSFTYIAKQLANAEDMRDPARTHCMEFLANVLKGKSEQSLLGDKSAYILHCHIWGSLLSLGGPMWAIPPSIQPAMIYEYFTVIRQCAKLRPGFLKSMTPFFMLNELKVLAKVNDCMLAAHFLTDRQLSSVEPCEESRAIIKFWIDGLGII